MKIELEQKDVNFINGIKEDLENNQDIPLFINNNTSKVSISIEIKDVPKANMFVYYLMSQNNTKDIEDTLGINVLSINYKDNKIEQVKKILQDALEMIDSVN